MTDRQPVDYVDTPSGTIVPGPVAMRSEYVNGQDLASAFTSHLLVEQNGRPNGAAVEQPRHFLGRLFSGLPHELEAFEPENFDFFDADLDAAQREAVARA